MGGNRREEEEAPACGGNSREMLDLCTPVHKHMTKKKYACCQPRLRFVIAGCGGTVLFTAAVVTGCVSADVGWLEMCRTNIGIYYKLNTRTRVRLVSILYSTPLAP